MATSRATDDEPELITFAVDGDWATHELVTLLEAVRRIYDAVLAASLVAGGEPTETIALSEITYTATPYQWFKPTFEIGLEMSEEATEVQTSRPSSIGSLQGFAARPSTPRSSLPAVITHLRALSPEATLKIHRIQMASPGTISFAGSGEVIAETRELIESTVQLDQTRKAAKLRNQAAQVDLKRKEREEQRDASLDEIAVARQRLKFVQDLLELKFGAGWRDDLCAQQLLNDILSGVKDLNGLMAAKPLALESVATTTQPAIPG